MVLFVLLSIPAILYGAQALNHHHIKNSVQQSVKTILQDVSERIGVIRTMLSSLEGLYYVSPDLDNGKLLHFSRNLLQNSPYITMLGRYESIAREERINFESRMTDNGHLDFRIREIDKFGKFVPRDDRSHYYPISILEPLKPENLAMVGVDFGSVSGMAKNLTSIAADKAFLLAPVPTSWSESASLVAFHPVYRGKEAPDSEKALLQQTTGGFWLNIDVDLLLSGITDVAKSFDVKVEIVEGRKRQTIYSQLSDSPEALYFSSLYPSHQVKEKWVTAAATSLVITLEKPVGFTSEAVILTAFALLAVALVAILYFSDIINRHRSFRERQSGQQMLFAEREKAEKTLNTVPDAIITLDAKLLVLQINPAAVLMLNTKPAVAVGKSLGDLVQFHEVKDKTRIFDIEQALTGLAYNGKRDYDVTPLGYNSEDYVLRLTLSSSATHDEVITGHVLILRDISHERRMSKKLAYQANYDALTGCTNRHYFEQTLDSLVYDMANQRKTHALCYMDLDQFKVVNDTCGHRAGDQLLIELTNKLKMIIRKEDVLSRLGGDEFGLLIVDVDREQAETISNSIYDFFQNFLFKYGESTYSITASIGVVHIDDNCANMKDVLAAADIACYSAKDSGRNSISVYSKNDQGMAERSIELSWLPKLQTALQQNQFRLHLQAVVSLSNPSIDYRTTHFEFLLRLADEDGKEITPWQIIQAAERYNLMRDIDKWVISNALRIVAELKSGPGGKCSYSINLSGQSAADPNLKTFIQDQMKKHAVDPSMIWFELTETAAISHFSIAVDLIKDIRSFGSKVALDDFGSGLSSYGYLKNLPVDIIKIDGQFVKEIANNPIDKEMVRAIHQIGQSMNIVTVAECVEDEATLNELIGIGVDYAQGFYIAKPQSVPSAIAWLSNKNSKAA